VDRCQLTPREVANFDASTSAGRAITSIYFFPAETLELSAPA
jgi:hypothetical protein